MKKKILILMIILLANKANAQVFNDRVKQINPTQFVSITTGDRYLVTCGKKYDGEIDISYEFDTRFAKNNTILRGIQFTIKNETCYGGVFPKDGDKSYIYNTKTNTREREETEKN